MKLEYGKIKGLNGLIFVLRDSKKIEAVYPFMCDKISKAFAVKYLKQKGVILTPQKADLSWLGFFLRGKVGLRFDVFNLDGTTDFRKKVYKKLFSTKSGTVLSYGELSKNSARAVGSAMKNNPFPLIIPCHRVSSKNGSERYTITCFCKKPSGCDVKDISACSKRIKKMVRDYETR